MKARRRRPVRSRILSLIVCLVFASGCAEITSTTRMMTMAMVELFRLPIYCLQIPFKIIQNMGPIIQSAMKTAVNLAPLLLFVEKQLPEDSMHADGRSPASLDERIDVALGSGQAIPLIPLLERASEDDGRARFILIDARLLRDPSVKRGIRQYFLSRNSNFVCYRVDGRGLFSERRRFLEVCEKMRERRGILIAITAFNDGIAAMTGNPEGVLPSEPDGALMAEGWERILKGAEAHVRGEG